MFDPDKFIDIAKNLCKPDVTEAECRTGISRTLYGIFLYAREELDRRGEKVKATTDDERPLEHSRVRQCFKHGKYQHSGVSQRLGGLYRLRYDSDYNLDANVQYKDLRQALEYADYIQNTFNNALFTKTSHSV